MLVIPQLHPDEQQLSSFLGGRLSLQQMEVVADHVEDCEFCCARLETLTAQQDEPLLNRMREEAREGGSEPGDAAPDACPISNEALMFAGYEILEEIGRGGMGVVYKARDSRLKRLVALKVILTGVHCSAKQRELLQEEAETIARLDHACIVQVFEVGEYRGSPYLVMELVEQGNLQQHTNRKPQAAEASAELLIQLAEAVDYAHKQGVIHRDLKPANVLMKRTTPKITDFGLAKQLDSQNRPRTRTGTILGTPCYMAPEQTTGKVDAIGPHADVYSLGAILYELLTGHAPFQAENVWETMRMTREEEPVPPRRLQPKLPRDLETICLRCLEKDSSRRYESATALAEDLRRYLRHEPVKARPIGLPGRTSRWLKRNPTAAALAAVVAAVVLIGLPLTSTLALWAWRQKGAAESAQVDLKQQRDEAEQSERDAKASEHEAQQLRLKADAEARRANALADKARASQREASKRLAEMYSAESVRAMDDGFYHEALALTFKSMDADLESRELAMVSEEPLLKDHLSARAEQILRQCPQVLSKTWLRSSDHASPLKLARFRLSFGEDDQNLRASHQLGLHSLGWGLAPDAAQPTTVSIDSLRRQMRLDDNGLWRLEVVDKQLRLTHLATDHSVELSATGNDVRQLRDSDSLRKLIVSDDGRLAALIPRLNLKHGLRDVLLWDVGTGELLSRTTNVRNVGPAHYILDAWFTPRGKWLVMSADLDAAPAHSVIMVLDTASGQLLEIAAPLLHAVDNGRIGSVDVSEEAGLLAAVSNEGITLWSLSPDEASDPRLIPVDYAEQIVRVDFDSTGSRLLTAGRDGTAVIRDVASGQLVSAPMKHRTPLSVACFSPDDARVLTASEDGLARVWRSQTGRPTTPYLRHEFAVVGAAWSERGDVVAVADQGGAVTVWDLKTPLESRLLMHPESVNAVQFAPDSRRLATACSDGSARIWDAPNGDLEMTLRNAFAVQDVQWDRSGGHLAVHLREWNEEAIGTRAAQIWDACSGKTRTFPIGRGLLGGRGPRMIRFSPSGEQLVLGLNPYFNLLDLNKARDAFQKKGLKNSLEIAFAPHRDDEVAYTTHSEACVYVLDSDTGDVRLRLGKPQGEAVTRLVYSPNGRYLAAAGEFGVRVWDLHDEARQLAPTSELAKNVVWIDFHPDFDAQPYLLTVSGSLGCEVRRVPDWQPQGAPFAVSGRPVLSQFSPASSHLITVANTGRIRVWDWRHGEPVTPNLNHGSQVSNASLSPDGRYLAVGSVDGAVQVWTLPQFEVRRSVNELVAMASASGYASDRSFANVLNVSPASDQFDVGTPAAAKRQEMLLAWHRHEAKECLRRRLWDSAAAHQQQALGLCPDDAALHRQLAETLHRAGQLDAAHDQWTAILTREETTIDDWLARGRVQFELKQWANALSDFEQAHDRFENDGAPLMWQCLVHLKQGRVEDADEAYEAVADRIWRVRSTVLLNRRRHGDQSQFVRKRWKPLFAAFDEVLNERAMEDASPAIQAAYFRGRGLASVAIEHWRLTDSVDSLGREIGTSERRRRLLFESWTNDFESAARLRPDDGHAHFALALLAYRRDDMREAARRFELSRSPTFRQKESYYLHAMTILRMKGPPDELLQVLDEAIVHGEDHADVRYLRALAWLRLKGVPNRVRQKLVMLDLSQAIASEPHGPALALRGQLWAAKGDWTRAFEDFRQVLETPGGDAVAGQLFVLSALQAGKDAPAKKVTNKLISRYGKLDKDLHLFVWLACLQSSFPEEELKPHVERLEGLQKSAKFGSRRTYAASLLRMGRAEEALAQLQGLLVRRSSDPALWLLLSMTQQQLGDRDASKEALETAADFMKQTKRKSSWMRRAELSILSREATAVIRSAQQKPAGDLRR